MASPMNKALMAKMGWRLCTENNNLWSKVLSSKYKNKNSESPLEFDNPATASPTWRGIYKGFYTLSSGTRWRVGNGEKIKFWKDRWLNSGVLMPYIPNQNLQDQLVCDYLGPGGWILDNLLQVLPMDIIREITAIYATSNSDISDIWIWGESNNGNFTVKSAYNLINNHHITPDWDWSFIWKIKIPPRISYYLWTLCHGKLYTNEQRGLRGLTDSVHCPRCGFSREDVGHVFRECRYARAIWTSLENSSPRQPSTHLRFLVWLRQNLRDNKSSIWNLPWASSFAIFLWFLWKWRCKRIFEPGWSPSQFGCATIKAFCSHWFEAQNLNSLNIIPSHWMRPKLDFIKLNVDGSRDNFTGDIGAGGLLRNHKGNWIHGFMFNIGKGSIIEAELWGILKGVEAARDVGVLSLVVESDSADAVKFINGDSMGNHPCANLIWRIHQLVGSFNSCTFNYISRRINQAADHLAGLSHDIQLGFVSQAHPPLSILPFLELDLLCSEGLS